MTLDSDEQVLAKQKKNGHTRASPQSESFSQAEENINVNLGLTCDKCTYSTINADELKPHMDSHKKQDEVVSCNLCGACFEN